MSSTPPGPRSGRFRPAVVAALVGATVFGPFAVGFANAQDSGDVSDLRQEREDNRREAAEVAAEIDALAARDEELLAAIEAIEAQITSQEADIAAAEESIADAEARVESARAEADALDGEMESIRTSLRLRAVDVFVSPRLDVLERLDSDDLLETELKQSYIDEWVGDEYQLIDQLRSAQARQDEAERIAEAAAEEAEATRVELAAQLDELDANKGEVESLRAEVEGRIGEWQAVGAEIEAADAAIADEIRQLEAELARQAEEEARIRAEEEAARLAAEEAAAAAGDDDEADDASQATTAPVALGPFSVTHRPVPGGISSSFGSRVHPIFGTVRNHYGLDFNAGMGEPIVAAADGVVLSADWMNGYGWTVVLSHGDGVSTLYAHQSEIRASVGASVSGGDVIGLVGSTGWSTGPHLHWEVRINGSAVDPAPYL